ncbi:cuticle collagen 1-like [Hirundo rustica]|uniref:cuticle collagen 1-like n=1 Tax=Hirundo rustica TaxID=43150 RepID=UPI001A9431B0|nr:cuticle collagen 1-like [Hirundo rustica]
MKPPGAVGTLLRALGRRDGPDAVGAGPGPRVRGGLAWAAAAPTRPTHVPRAEPAPGGALWGLRGAPGTPRARVQSLQSRRPQEMREQGDVTVPTSAPARAEAEHGPGAAQRARGLLAGQRPPAEHAAQAPPTAPSPAHWPFSPAH